MNDYKIFLIDKDGSYGQLELESLDFSTTFSINDIKDISKRKDTISKNIKILGTKNNNRVLGNLFNLNRFVSTGSINLNYNYKANNQTNCIIYENNMVVLKGQLQIIDVAKDENGDITYNAVVTGGVVNFFQKVKDLDLSDLDFGNDNHQVSLTTIYNSWDSTNNYPFIYPSIDYGVSSTYSNNYDFRNFRCGVYLKTYLDAIFGSFGYTYTSSFANTEVFKRCYIPYPEKTFNRVVKGDFFSGYTNTGFHYLSAPNAGLNSEAINFSASTNNFVTVETARKENGSNVQSFKFSRNLSTTGSLRIDNLRVFGDEGSALGRIAIYPVNQSTNNINYSTPLVFRDFSVYNSETLVNDFTLQLPFADYTENSEFAVMCVARGDWGTSRLRFAYTGATISFGDKNTATNAEIQQGDNVKISDVIPQNFKVYTLLTDILKIFNLYITENPNKINDFIVEDYDVFYSKAKQPKLNALNWSDKLDNDELLTSFNLTIPKRYSFNFKEDGSDFWGKEYQTKYNTLYGNALIKNDAGYSDESKIEVNFSPTLLVRNSTDNKVMPNIFSGNLTAREQYKSNLRLLFNNGTGSTTSYDIAKYNPTGTTVTYATNVGVYNHSSHLLRDDSGNYIFNLQFGTPNEVFFPVTTDIFSIPNLYTNYYKNQINELIDPNFSTFECRVWLNESDISNLDFTTPIYINTEEWGNAYFKLLQVDYKTSKELSKVKLQKIII